MDKAKFRLLVAPVSEESIPVETSIYNESGIAKVSRDIYELRKQARLTNTNMSIYLTMFSEITKEEIPLIEYEVHGHGMEYMRQSSYYDVVFHHSINLN
jgi:hypothetical protein